MAMHVLVGKPEDAAEEDLRDLARSGGTAVWTVPRVAHQHDDVIFFMLNPRGAFVATGRLQDGARPGTSDRGKGNHVATVGSIKMLGSAVARLDMARLAQSWGWPRQPHTAATIPPGSVADVNRALSR